MHGDSVVCYNSPHGMIGVGELPDWLSGPSEDSLHYKITFNKCDI